MQPSLTECRGACLLAVLLFVLIPLTATVQVTQNLSYALAPLNCQPDINNAYPENANSGEKIVIVTTVTNGCVTVDYNQVIVNILLPNTSRILSTAPASPAINTVTAPATGGLWSLIVQVLWINYPTAGTLATFQTTITININGPLTVSTVTFRTVYSTNSASSRIATSSTVLSPTTVTSAINVSSSTGIQYTTVTLSKKNLTSTSMSPTTTNKYTLNTPSTLPSNPSSNILRYPWQDSTLLALILTVVVVLLLVAIFALKRRHR